ncbi:hypothetical protein GCM10017714_11430 [Curtobacterium pusillum]|uniref:Uncharacterized protein n=1 Tax=Curtobacterium pusillum TaxID=69373 RepID=A0ABX2MAH2_9MICO|nr:hypothetical protein [Curtobacterium pusillum]NUU13793.1 hypothetical protein [Curtobacterium pusillum]GLK30403.1 hypothetical protein GCM10017610_06880 [Curtobacterium pusillum]
MTDAIPTGAAEPRLQAAPPVSVPDALTGELTLNGLAAPAGLEARPGLLTLVTPGGAPVCEGDSCLVDAAFVPGAEGVWVEVPD